MKQKPNDKCNCGSGKKYKKCCFNIISNFNIGNNYISKQLFQEAIVEYEKAIALKPNHKEAYNKLGTCYNQQNDYNNAIKMFQKAVSLDPNYKDAYINLVNCYFNLGNCYIQQKKYNNAIEIYNKMISQNLIYKEVYNNLGSCYYYKKQYEDSIKIYTKSIEIYPNYIDCYNNLGKCYLDIKDFDNALQHLQKAISIDPNNKESYNHLGNCYLDQNKLHDAIIMYKKAIKIDSNYKEGYNNLGNGYSKLKQFDSSMIMLQKAIEIDPNYKEAYNNLGNWYQLQYLFQEAIIQYNKAITIDPNYKEAYRNMAICYQHLKELDKFIKNLEKCISIDPNYIEAIYDSGYYYLYNKYFKKGFELYEYRFKLNRPIFKKINLINLNYWNGINEAKRIIIVFEQGFGDIFMFFRFIIPLKEKFPSIQFEFLCEKKITHLLVPIIPIYHSDILIHEYDYKLPLLSIPHILQLTNITPYTDDLYIQTNHDKNTYWKAKLAHLKNYKIGLCWKGNTNIVINKHIPLELLQSISELNVDLICLQKNDGIEELQTISFKDKMHVFDIDIDEAFTDTIAIMQNIDLLITVDTSLVHLAGLLGIKTWLALGFVSEWRWGIHGSDTYWYDSVKLFRSKTQNNWTEILDEMKNELNNSIL